MGLFKKPRLKKVNFPLKFIGMLLNANSHSNQELDDVFTYCLALNPELTFKIVLWYRLTQLNSAYLYRRFLYMLVTYSPAWVAANIHLIAEFGDVQDLLWLTHNPAVHREAKYCYERIQKYGKEYIVTPFTVRVNETAKSSLKIIESNENFKMLVSPILDKNKVLGDSPR